MRTSSSKATACHNHLRLDSFAYNYRDALKLSRDEAIKADVPVYWTGAPCAQGHLAHRFVSNRACLCCTKIASEVQRNKKFARESRLAGINPDMRRKAEDLHEQRRLEREFETFGLAYA